MLQLSNTFIKSSIIMTFQQQAHTVCQRFNITTPNLRIGGKRPNHHGGMVTHGTYVTGLPISMGGPYEIALYNICENNLPVPKRRLQVTLAHELCHHIEMTYFKQTRSPHTASFYSRCAIILRALRANRAPTIKSLKDTWWDNPVYTQYNPYYQNTGEHQWHDDANQTQTNANPTVNAKWAKQPVNTSPLAPNYNGNH